MVHKGLFHLACSATFLYNKAHLPRLGTAHNGLGAPDFSYQTGNCPKDMPIGQSVEGNAWVEAGLPRCVNLAN